MPPKITDSDVAAWAAEIASVRPTDSKKATTTRVAATTEAQAVKHAATPSDQALQRNHEPLTIGNYAGVDAATARKFRRGQIRLDATLDLHGMTKEEAFVVLSSCVREARQRKIRCLLVITGKGPENQGVLRNALSGWLGHTNLRPHILAFDIAHPKHGGNGAFYILLKQKRV